MTERPKRGRGRPLGKFKDAEFLAQARAGFFLPAYVNAREAGKSDQAAIWIGIAAVNSRVDKDVPITKSNPKYILMSESEAKRILAKWRRLAKGGKFFMLPELMARSQWPQSRLPDTIGERSLTAVVAVQVGPLPKFTPAEPIPPPGARRKQKIRRTP